MQGSLEEDLAALRRLREDDASGALKEKFGDDEEDPREWDDGDAVTVEERVMALDLSCCEKLAALPGAIGELKALTELSLFRCSSLAALPVAIGGLKATERGCKSLAALPDSMGKLGALTSLN